MIRAIAKRARASGRRVVRMVERRVRPARLEILTYHFVTAHTHSFNRNGHVVSPGTFAAQLRWLKATHDVIALRDLATVVPGRRPLAAVTFDDGYASNLTEAYPILEAERVPATMFVCPSVLDNRDLLWRDKVRLLIDTGRAAAFVAYLRTLPERKYRFAELGTRPFYAWSKHLASIGDMQIQADLDAYCAREGLETAALAAREGLFLAERDLAPRPYLDFGCHSWSHPVMPALDLAGQRVEIGRAQDFLAARGVPSVGFALPFTDYNADTVRACEGLASLMLTVEKRSNPLPLAAAPLRILHRRMAPATLRGLVEIM